MQHVLGTQILPMNEDAKRKYNNSYKLFGYNSQTIINTIRK